MKSAGCRAGARRSGMRCSRIVASVASVLILALGPVLAHAEDESSNPPNSSFFVQKTLPWLSQTGAACANEPNGSVSDDCLLEQTLNGVVMEEFSRLASEQGKFLFGANFRMVNRLSWSPGGTGLTGDIDTVFPLSIGAALGPDEVRTESGALFLQWGVSRYTDERGMRRDDLRYGLVRRFALTNTPGADVFGVSGLFQQGLESGHKRFVIGLDYAGRWGTGWFRQYTPATGWRTGRSGFQERALEGAELGLGLTPTTTIGLATALTRWEDKLDLGKWRTGARVGLEWRPHPWLSFRTGWEDPGDSDRSASFGVRFSMPLGGGNRQRPRWEGLGLAGVGSGSEANARDIWRPLDNVGPIQIVERAIPSSSPTSQLPSLQAPDADECQAGQKVRPGESCAYPGSDLDFTVLATGSGRLGSFASGRSLSITSDRSLNIVNMTINGQQISFVANRQDDGSWLIERVGDSAFGGVPDLVVGSPSVSDGSPAAGASFTLSATVRNEGDGQSAATTLRYYRSSDATISASDAPVGTGEVVALPASGTSPQTISLTAPSSAGTYHYGACADAVSGEADTANNCSDAVTLTVLSGDRPADTVPHFFDTIPAQTYTAGTAVSALTLPAAYGGDGALTYTLAPAVPGLSFDAATRRLSGTPTQAGAYRMAYRAADADANTADSDAAIRSFTITVQAAGDFAPRMYQTVAAQTYTAGTAIVPLTLPAAYGGDGALTYTLAPAVPGLSFDAATRRLSGTPTQAGAYRMAYRAADADANTADSDAAIRTFTITVQAAPGAVPDLALESAYATPSGRLDGGQRFIFGVTVRNRGDGESLTNPTLRYYLSLDATISADDREVGTDHVDRLAVSGRADEAITLSAPSTPGTYYYGACVGAVPAETNTSNNCSSAVAVTVEGSLPSGGPDLSVQHFYANPDNSLAGETFTLVATVRNRGDQAAAATTLRYYRSTDATITTSDTEVGTGSVAGLAASARGNVLLAQTAPSDLGTYYYGACVDAVAGESDTANNCSPSATVTVIKTRPQPLVRPDLALEAAYVAPSSRLDGRQRFIFGVTVRNRGDGESLTNPTLRYYLSLDATISTDDREVGTDHVDRLAVSGKTDETISLTAPYFSGTYYYGACVGAVPAETNTSNNCSSAVAVTVSGETPPEPPDLRVQSVSATPDSLIAGQIFTLSAGSHNNGGEDAAATTLRYYRSSDSTITTSDTQVGTDAIAALKAYQGGGSESVTLTAPSSPGTYYYGACLDSVSGETNTANNCSSAVAVTVRSAPPGTPDTASGRYGAFALSIRSCDQGGAVGLVVDRASQVEALNAARQACLDDGGRSNGCTPHLFSEQCLAVGFGVGGAPGCTLGPTHGATVAAAAARRLSFCRDRQGFTTCTIVASGCNSQGSGS